MYYRRKLLFSLIRQFDVPLSGIQLQTLLFAVCSHQKKKSYYFIPGKDGAFSFQVLADRNRLALQGFFHENEDRGDAKEEKSIVLVAEDDHILREVVNDFKRKPWREFLKNLCRRNPFHAINYELPNNIFDEDLLSLISSERPTETSPCFFTIGYEGIALEEYLNKLIKANVSVLCDVRKNALSRKFGFSKNQLSEACHQTGIRYLHMPQLGIPSELRHGQNPDYESLFDFYAGSILPNEKESLANLQKMAESHRLAVTCFEANEKQCHRGRLAREIEKMMQGKIQVRHL